MDISTWMQYCRQKPYAEECTPFGPWPVCYKLRGKIFAQLYPDMLTVKCTRFQGELFRQQYPGALVRGYHRPPVQQPYWNTIYLDKFPAESIPMMIDLGYDAVYAALPKKIQNDLKEIK